MSSTRSQPRSLQGQWVVAETRPVKVEPDTGGPLRQRELGGVLAVGPATYHGVSVKTALHQNRSAYNLLVGRMKRAAQEGVPVDDDGLPDSASGTVWKVRVLPIRSPITHVVVAVMGAFIRSRSDWADYPPPAAGSWEWLITEGGTDHHNVMGWSDALFELYGLTPPVRQRTDSVAGQDLRPRYPHGRWFDAHSFVTSRVLEPWRPAIRSLRDQMLTQPDQLHLCSFKTFHNKTGAPLALRIAARGDAEQPGWFRGVTMPDPDAASGLTPARDRPPGARAALTLSPQPLVVVDCLLEEIDLTNEAFDRLDLAVGADGHIRRCVDFRSQAPLIDLLHRAAAEPDRPVGPERIRWATLGPGMWQDYDVVAAGEPIPDGSGAEVRYVVCRLDEPTNG
jgi:hypothetical protein